jgi:hypothetical protein
MPATYEPIATTTLGTTQNQIDFSSISGSYTDLVLIMGGGVTGSADIWLRMNGDTGSNYSRTRLYGDGSSTASSRNSAASSIFVSVGAVGANSVMVTQIMNYSNSTTYKTTVTRHNSSTYLSASVGLWRSTSAITSLTLKAEAADTFTVGSTFTLYGIKAVA